MFYCSLLRFMKVGALQIGHKGFIFKEFLRQSWQNVWPQFMLTGSNKISAQIEHSSSYSNYYYIIILLLIYLLLFI
jgi:hypothetical protein